MFILHPTPVPSNTTSMVSSPARLLAVARFLMRTEYTLSLNTSVIATSLVLPKNMKIAIFAINMGAPQANSGCSCSAGARRDSCCFTDWVVQGFYQTSTSNGQVTCSPCPAGTYGQYQVCLFSSFILMFWRFFLQGLTSAKCSGKCTAGYYCPQGSSNSTAVLCPAVSIHLAVGG